MLIIFEKNKNKTNERYMENLFKFAHGNKKAVSSFYIELQIIKNHTIWK